MFRYYIRSLFVSVAFVSLTVGNVSWGQNSTCYGSGRYIDSIFSCVEITRDRVYGSGSLDWSWNNLLCLDLRLPPYNQQINLRYDIYEPCFDSVQKRPLIVMVHGGAWAGGNKNDMEAAAIRYAKKGYVVASINYRLALPANILCWNQDADEVRLLRAAYRGIVDTKLALRHFREEAGLFKIDTSAIFLVGVSAGGFNAVGAAFMDSLGKRYPACDAQPQLGNWFGQWYFPDMGEITGDQPGSTKTSLKAVINISGGTLSSDLFTQGNYPPVLSIQGDADDVVPYNTSCLLPAVRSLGLYAHCILSSGAGALDSLFKNKNLDHTLITLSGATHAFTPAELDRTLSAIDTFLCEQLSISTYTSEINQFMEVETFLHPNPANGICFITSNKSGILHMYNGTGQLAISYTFSIIPVKASISLDQLKPGLYYWMYTTPSGLSGHGKLVVN
jgi:acetyl esterase/lipase